MKNQIINSVSAYEINIVRSSLMIPLLITVVCSTLDLFFHIRFNMVDFECCEECVFWVLETLISYFFPTFLSATVSLIIQCFVFTDNWSGVKDEKGFLLIILTLIYLVLYIIYLTFTNTKFVYVFCVINILYVWLVLNKCIDEKILKRLSTKPNNTVKNVPF